MTFLSEYKTTGVAWTRRRGTKVHETTWSKTGMKRFKVFIDDGLVGHVLGEDIMSARTYAIGFYNIAADQRVRLEEY